MVCSAACVTSRVVHWLLHHISISRSFQVDSTTELRMHGNSSTIFVSTLVLLNCSAFLSMRLLVRGPNVCTYSVASILCNENRSRKRIFGGPVFVRGCATSVCLPACMSACRSKCFNNENRSRKRIFWDRFSLRGATSARTPFGETPSVCLSVCLSFELLP